MKHRFPVSLQCVLALGGMMAPFAIASAQADTVVKIGFASPLSGPQAHYGKDNENATKMAIDDLNAKALTIAGQKVRFELVSEDDQADPRVGTQVAQRLVDSGVKAVLGHFNSGVSIPASRIYSDAGIPQLSVSTNPAYTQQGYKTTFRLVGSDSQVGGALGQFVVKALKAKTIVAIDDRTAYGQGIADEFVKAVQGQGGKVARREYTNDKATDFTAILTSIKPLNPDVVFYGGADAQSAPMAKQMKRLGVKAPLVSGEMTKTPTFLKLSGTDGDGTIASLAGLPLEQMPKGKDYESRYKARFKTDVATYSPYGYDATMAMIDAMKQANSSDPAKYLPVLAKIQHSGVTSSEWAYDDKGDLKNGGITLYKVENGQWKVLETIGGGSTKMAAASAAK
jgi:branched-chain amino acid transport system substrate-binding protein